MTPDTYTDAIKYCITTWGAILKVNRVKDGLVWVSDPDAVDAGQDISTTEVSIYWLGYRPKDKWPEEGQRISICTNVLRIEEALFENGMFIYKQDNKPENVVLWGKQDSPF